MSSGSESDEDYVPREPEQVSEEGSADEETDLQYEKELDHKSQKRKITQSNKGKKKQRKNISSEQKVEPDEKKQDAPKDTEEEKKREEDLWAKFLEGTDTKSKAVQKETTVTTNSSQGIQPMICSDKSKIDTRPMQKKDDAKDKERRIFEFAGETIVVENDVIKEKIKSTGTTATGSNGLPSRSRNSGGLSGVLNNLNKKNSLSTLEKSKLDWVTYKKQEGIEEEIESHNKGKAGYLDRQDFLERADVRQYEIERDLRMSRRSNR